MLFTYETTYYINKNEKSDTLTLFSEKTFPHE